MLYFENNEHRTSHKIYFLLNVKVKTHNYWLLIAEIFVDELFGNYLKTYKKEKLL